MRFGRTPEQSDFAEALSAMLAAADVPTAARTWAADELAAGTDLWSQLAEAGVTALLVPEAHGGLGAGAVDMTVAFEVLGQHAVPGPWVDSVVVAPLVLLALGDPKGLVPGLLAGTERAAVAVPPLMPFAGDVRAATVTIDISGGAVHDAAAGELMESVDASRRPARLLPGAALGELAAEQLDRAVDLAVLATAAQLLGCGRRLLADTVAYAAVRSQFGRPIGEFQAIKHLLADVRVALDFAAPLVHGAAASADASSIDRSRDVSAAKVAAGDAAWLAARTALQVHGAIGYTVECDLSLWFTKVRALVGSWGTPSVHRGRVLAALTARSREQAS